MDWCWMPSFLVLPIQKEKKRKKKIKFYTTRFRTLNCDVTQRRKVRLHNAEETYRTIEIRHQASSHNRWVFLTVQLRTAISKIEERVLVIFLSVVPLQVIRRSHTSHAQLEDLEDFNRAGTIRSPLRDYLGSTAERVQLARKSETMTISSTSTFQNNLIRTKRVNK